MKLNIGIFEELPEFALKCKNVSWALEFDFPHNEEILYEFIQSPNWPEAVNAIDQVKCAWDIKFRATSIYRNMLKHHGGNTLLIVGDDRTIEEHIGHKYCEVNTIDIRQFLKDDIDKKDLILMYDILDHMPEARRNAMMGKAKSLMHEGSRLIIRFHPWMSIHGGHCYDKLNKAYSHLFLGPKVTEYQSFYVDRISNPATYYDDLVAKHDLSVVSVKYHKMSIPEFINQPDVLEYVALKYKQAKEIITKALQILYIDYVVKLPNHSS